MLSFFNDKLKTMGCHKPGTTVQQSGIYREQKTSREAACVRGEPFPPTSTPGDCWTLVRPSNP